MGSASGRFFSSFPSSPDRLSIWISCGKRASFWPPEMPLLVAIDAGAVKRVDLPVGEGWTFQMAAGAVRLAIRHRKPN